MKRKITILMFGLLLAVGWTNGAQAQALPKHKVATDVANVGRGLNSSEPPCVHKTLA